MTMDARSIEIIEIIRPAEQGVSKPYVCRGEDGEIYFVKGRNASRRSQINEWICGHLAVALGLPVPPFRVVEVPAELVEEAPVEMQEIGAGPAFGSMQASDVIWFERPLIAKVEDRLQRDILVFDWWVHNEDRTIGNANLLWKAGESRLVVIDHNQAFDPQFLARDFLVNHVFARQVEAVFGDLAERSEYQRRTADALAVWEDAIVGIPDEWRWLDEEQTLAVDYDYGEVERMLNRCEQDEFWRRP